MLAARLDEHDETPVDDRIVVLRHATWADYQRMLELRGEVSVPRIAYLRGDLQVMTPSRPHESLKSTIGRLVEVWCLENSIDFSPYGSWTLEKKEEACGIEPDEPPPVAAPVIAGAAVEAVSAGAVLAGAAFAPAAAPLFWVAVAVVPDEFAG